MRLPESGILRAPAFDLRAPLGRARTQRPAGVLVIAGHEGVGASVTAALLAIEAQAQGARVLLVGPDLRAQRLAALFGVMLPSPDFPPVTVDRDIQVASHFPAAIDADVILSVPVAQVQPLLDAVDALTAQTSRTQAVVLAQRGAGPMAAAFAVLKLIATRRPKCPTTVAACGDADLSSLQGAAERWLGRPLRTAPALPLDPTLPIALSAGIPLAEAVADSALTSAAGALWHALSTSASTGVLS